MNTINLNALAAIREAVTIAKGPSNLARALGVSPQMVSQWTCDLPDRNRSVAARHCKAIEEKFGVSRTRLRPDDWHQYWGDLIGAPGSPPVPGAFAAPEVTPAEEAA
ncbi:transcriptional regulator [Paraburkholderia dioscoreae]|jgi:DNA-binding transcriptional regulator YdaS (Cro superfamily)|nr:YdaS family helix-turn-helix protein [Paraburkholderia dioscoreae]